MNHQYLAQKAFVKFFSNTPDDKNRWALYHLLVCTCECRGFTHAEHMLHHWIPTTQAAHTTLIRKKPLSTELHFWTLLYTPEKVEDLDTVKEHLVA
jgi:hypothetical protein